MIDAAEQAGSSELMPVEMMRARGLIPSCSARA
jgi:hypothetical protein